MDRGSWVAKIVLILLVVVLFFLVFINPLRQQKKYKEACIASGYDGLVETVSSLSSGLCKGVSIVRCYKVLADGTVEMKDIAAKWAIC